MERYDKVISFRPHDSVRGIYTLIEHDEKKGIRNHISIAGQEKF